MVAYVHEVGTERDYEESRIPSVTSSDTPVIIGIAELRRLLIYRQIPFRGRIEEGENTSPCQSREEKKIAKK